MATREWKRKILERDCHQCRICGTKGSKENPLTIHHKLPVARNGASSPENTVCWCSIDHHLYHKKWGLTTSDDYGNPIEPRYSGKTKRKRRRHKHHH